MWTKEQIPAQAGKIIVVTGANTGIGFETALALYEAGAHVILACRSLDNAEQAVARIQTHKGRGTLETGVLDLSSLASVEAFANTIRQKHQQLHVVINNAGVMIPPASKTVDGFELQFGVNFIGHFALIGRLYPLLNATPGARVVSVSSLAYLRGKIDFENLRSENSYDPMREYCQSKLANIIFAVELQRRVNATNGHLLVIAAQPGANKTDLARYMDEAAYAAALERFGTLMDPWQGALPSLYAAVADRAIGGALYGPDQDEGVRGYPAQGVITANALNEALALKLWSLAEEATGVSFPVRD
ncbi:NAD(P)-dependent dehydrogenase (short-subunit alcohol dehydrogenase family) [Filimonas zeae]|nr:oxidoreductase [Filimonas zeae]MDR6341482.1 NAD(P)-dependent dehydrogenase (short-subunit alcohol dehydrogenase family) [Filimonas zeae]